MQSQVTKPIAVAQTGWGQKTGAVLDGSVLPKVMPVSASTDFDQIKTKATNKSGVEVAYKVKAN